MKPRVFQELKGLKILICSNPNSNSVASLILVKAGTDLETKENNGISHFIEHLYFKGTKNFPSAKILMENLDKIGGVYNAFTSYQYTGFYVKVLPEFIDEAIFILSDILLAPLFPDEEIEKERKVIFEEINLHLDNPASLVLDLGYKLAFGDQPAGWPILGSKKTISRIEKRNILDYVKKNYSQKNTLIILSGKIENLNKLIKEINKRFSSYNSKSYNQKVKFIKPKDIYQEKIYRKQTEQAHIFLGFPLEGGFQLKERKYILALISIILGEKSSSRLFLKIREELGGAYYIRSNFVDYLNRSLFYVQAGLNLDNFEFLLERIFEEIDNLRKNNLEEAEIEIAKSFLKSSLFIDLEENLNLAMFYGRRYLLENKIETPQEIIKKIDSLKKADILNEIKRLIDLRKVKIVAILPKTKRIKISKILKKFLK